jgi:hypothetical protein
VIEIAGLGGRERVETLGLPAFSLVQFDAG